jgi:phage protein D
MPPPTTLLVLAPDIRVNGSPVPAADHHALVELHVSHAIGVPSELTLRFADDEFELLDGNRYVVGATIEVRFPTTPSTLVSVFEGEILSVGVDQQAERHYQGCELTVTALDKSHRLGRETKVRTFQRLKYSQIVATIAAEVGLRSSVEDTGVTFDYLIQTTTNYAFLEEIAFRTGFEWRIDGDQLIFGPRAATTPIRVTYGEDLRRIRARFSAASEAATVTVRSWDPSSKRPITANQTMSAARESGATGGDSSLVTSGRQKSRAFGKPLGASSLVATSSDEAQQLAEALGARVATADLEVRGECLGRPLIKPGSTVRIDKAGTKLSGTYYVTSVDHHFGRDGDMVTTFATGPRDSSSIVELLGGAQERVGPFGRLGLTIGIVTNNKDPDGLGRVRVKFPALSESEESWWARVVTPGGGSQAGLIFIPQIDDEVLVGFEHGDLRRPFVLGGLWGPSAHPPLHHDAFLAQNKVVEWGLKTLNGSTLAIRSGTQPAEKHYKVALPDGTTHYMGSDKTEIVAMNKSIELKSGAASILISDQGDIQIKGANIKLQATQGVTIDGLTIASKANTSYKAEGGTTIELKGGPSATLEASGVTQVKGALVKIQ